MQTIREMGSIGASSRAGSSGRAGATTSSAPTVSNSFTLQWTSCRASTNRSMPSLPSTRWGLGQSAGTAPRSTAPAPARRTHRADQPVGPGLGCCSRLASPPWPLTCAIIDGRRRRPSDWMVSSGPSTSTEEFGLSHRPHRMCQYANRRGRVRLSRRSGTWPAGVVAAGLVAAGGAGADHGLVAFWSRSLPVAR